MDDIKISSANDAGVDRQSLEKTNSAAELTASEFLDLFRKRKISALEYAEALNDRTQTFDPHLLAWEYFDPDMFLSQAREIDRTFGTTPSSNYVLPGVPVAVKDIFNTFDMPTGMGSPITADYNPGNDARVVSNIRLEKGIIMGKTVTAEFAVHHPGKTLNPYDITRSPGTSSSGSAVAVATRMAPVALASQTGGSIIRPASYCGIMGFKPSFGLIPRTAMLKTTDTFDTVGFMARSLDDLQLIFEVTRTRGPNYPISDAALNDPERQKSPERGWRVGLVEGVHSSFEAETVRTQFLEVAEKLADAGCDVLSFKLPGEFDHAFDVHKTIYHKALSYYFKYEWNDAPQKFSPLLRAIIKEGLAIGTERYQECLRQQVHLANIIDRAYSDIDILICPSTSDEAPLAPEGNDLPDHCAIWTMCGLPVLSLPLLSGTRGLPVGFQIIARRYSDYRLFNFARHLLKFS